MRAILLILSAVGISAQGVSKKHYNGRTGGRGVYIFGAMSVLFSCLFFLFTSGFKLSFVPRIIPYSIGFALSYGTAIVFGFLAIKLGALSLTSLITSFSLTIPTLYGLVFLKERASVFFFVGIGFLVISLFLINSRSGEIKITVGWVIAVSLAFLGNGICSVFQNAQQRAFSGEYKSEFMIISLSAVTAVLFILALLSERGNISYSMRRGAHLMALCGAANGAVNLFVMMLATRMAASVMFPVISGGGIILTWCVSRFIYKEKLSLMQNLALVFGVFAIVLMNI